MEPSSASRAQNVYNVFLNKRPLPSYAEPKMFAVCELGGNAATCEIATGFPHQPTFSGQKEYFLDKKNISWAKNIFEQKNIISAQNKDVLWWTIRIFIQNFVKSQINQIDISDYSKNIGKGW